MASSIQQPQPQPQEPSLEPKPEPSPSPSPSRQLIPMPTATLTPMSASTPDSDSTDYDTTPIPMAIPMGVPIVLPPVRRLPPPCWTPDETSVLIDAYRDIWFSLRRANLRANHWQDVADTIHSHCPHVHPPKTAVQCRHKMEKLRKRYRAELLRAKSIPHHRFSSSWVYFSKMDSIDKSSSDNININNNSAASLPSPQPLSSVPFAAAHDASAQQRHHDDHLTPRTYSQPRPTPYPTHRFPTPPSHSHRPPPTFAPDFDDSPPPNPTYAFNNNYPAAPPPPKSAYTSNYGTPHYNNASRFVNTNDDNNTGSAGPSGMGLEMDYVNASSSSKKKRKMMMSNGGLEKRDKGEDSGGMEMVQAIRMLGESFLNMEKMKMDMMRETERLRMEMEMKRTQMLLDSQHRIIQAFAKGWTDAVIDNTDDHDAAS
ncbi:uncharacterized protein LOC141621098 [Silene latifolia]|uniref:uncharacterized protein LOC141621098 n=1 Tax=Silene latifolia TaxID=37657 RepID=UPI003D77D92D